MKYYFENARKFPELSELVTYIRATNGQEAIVLKNGGSIEFIARSKSSGRGFTVDVLVCDEAQELTDEQMEAIQPAISSAPSGNPLTIYTGTPTPPTSPGTVFARMRRNAHRDKPPKNLCWFEWAATEIGDVHDQQRWYQYNPSLGTRLLKSVVVSESEKMTPDGFARDVSAGGTIRPARCPISMLTSGPSARPTTLAWTATTRMRSSSARTARTSPSWRACARHASRVNCRTWRS